jgi:hypothetical protein
MCEHAELQCGFVYEFMLCVFVRSPYLQSFARGNEAMGAVSDGTCIDLMQKSFLF